MKKFILLLVSLVLVLSLSACKEDTVEEGNVIYVSVYPMQYLVEEIAGDTVTVVRIPGASTHGDYVEWSIKEIIAIKKADILFYISGGADDYIPNSAETFEGGNVELIDMSQHVEYNEVCYTHSHDEHDENDENESECTSETMSPDPHFWLDPVRMAEAAEYIKDKLIATYPENSDVIENNYVALNASLTQLNSEYEAMALEATKPIITTVMLFTYWHERYDLEIISITTDAHSSSATIEELAELKEHAIHDGITYILFEQNANSPAGDSVLESLEDDIPGISALYLHGCGEITPDEKANGETYLSLMYKNLEVLKTSTK